MFRVSVLQIVFEPSSVKLDLDAKLVEFMDLFIVIVFNGSTHYNYVQRIYCYKTL